MCFGAAASVWNFNRAADAVQMLLRSLLLVLLGHFVDDLQRRGRGGFGRIRPLRRRRLLRPPRAPDEALQGTGPGQAPRGLQGVELTIRPEGVELSPTAQRTEKDPWADRRRADQRQPLS